MKDQLLEKKINDNLKEIDEVVSKDPENKSKHLHNTLQAIIEIFNSASNYRVALQELYTKDPYMKAAADALATTSLIISGQLSDMQDLFDAMNNKELDFSDYVIGIQQELAVKLADHYNNLITYNEDFELSLIGESQ